MEIFQPELIGQTQVAKACVRVLEVAVSNWVALLNLHRLLAKLFGNLLNNF